MAKMRCGECGSEMKEEVQELFGEKIKVNVCRCGKELISVKDLTRLQKKALPKIHEKRKITTAGSSHVITIPKELSMFFKKGDEVMLDFDPEKMELRIKKAV